MVARCREKRIAVACSLTLSILSAMPAVFADDLSTSGSGDIFSTQKWSIVPAGQSAPESAKPSHKSETGSSFKISPQSTEKIQPITQSGRRSTPSSSSAPVEAAPMKLYGRIEELSTTVGAKIPLKMVAMTPIRDASLDTKLAAKATNTKLNGKTQWIATNGVKIQPIYDDSHPKGLEGFAKDADLSASASKEEPEIPEDFSGSWSGDMTVFMVDFGSNMFEFDRKEAEQQQRLITQGRQGRCTVSFTSMGGRVEMQPTQVVFSAPLSQAIQDMGQGNSTIAALGGLLGNNNQMLAGKTIPEFALPLGMMASNRGVTGNTLGSELMKNQLKQPAKGIIEEQIVTRDSDRNQTGQVKVTFSESDLRFRRTGDSQLYLEAAAVSYDEQGNYLNKVILKGYLDKGAPVADSGQSQIDLMGGGGAGGAGGLGGLGGLLGGQGGDGGQGGLGGLGGLLQGGAGGNGGNGGLGGLGGLLQGGGNGGNGGQGGLGGLGGLLQGGGGGNGGGGMAELGKLLQGGGAGGQGGGLGGLQGLFGGGNGSGGGQNSGGYGSPMQAPQNMMNEMNEVQKLLQE